MLDLTPAELKTLAGLVDAGVRHVGIRALTDEAVSIFKKLDVAAQAIPQEPAAGEHAS